MGSRWPKHNIANGLKGFLGAAFLGGLDEAVYNIDNMVDELNENKANETEIKQELAIERARINQITNTPGSTTGDLALNDIKIGLNGKTYDSPGDAVREQIKETKEYIQQTVDIVGMNREILSKTRTYMYTQFDILYNGEKGEEYCFKVYDFKPQSLIQQLQYFHIYLINDSDKYQTIDITNNQDEYVKVVATQNFTKIRFYIRFQEDDETNPMSVTVEYGSFRIIKNLAKEDTDIKQYSVSGTHYAINRVGYGTSKKGNTIIVEPLETDYESATGVNIYGMHNDYDERSYDTIATVPFGECYVGELIKDYDHINIALNRGNSEIVSTNVGRYYVGNITNNSLYIYIKELEKKATNKQIRKYFSVSILGDSYSTFQGFTEPVNNTQYYPIGASGVEGTSGNVVNVEQTWWYLFSTESKCILNQNNSYSGSPICYDGYRSGNADAEDYSYVKRCRNLKNAELIIIEGATNDSHANVSIGEYKYSDWNEDDFKTFRPSLAYVINYVKSHCIGSQIIFMLNNGLKQDINNSVHTICDYYEVPVLDLKNIDKIAGHPTIIGMQQINMQLKEFLDNLSE